jgi:hypothetical protein
MEAALAGTRNVADFLLQLGADRSGRTRYGLSAEDLAAEKGNRVMVDLIRTFERTPVSESDVSQPLEELRQGVKRAFGPDEGPLPPAPLAPGGSVYRIETNRIVIEDLNSERTTLLGDFAVDRGTYASAAGSRRYLILCERQPDETWKIRFLMLG